MAYNYINIWSQILNDYYVYLIYSYNLLHIHFNITFVVLHKNKIIIYFIYEKNDKSTRIIYVYNFYTMQPIL